MVEGGKVNKEKQKKFRKEGEVSQRCGVTCRQLSCCIVHRLKFCLKLEQINVLKSFTDFACLHVFS